MYVYLCRHRMHSQILSLPFATDALQSHSFFSHLSVLPKSSRNNFTLKTGTSIGPVIVTKTPFMAWSAGTYTLHSLINRSAKAAPIATVLRTSMYASGLQISSSVANTRSFEDFWKPIFRCSSLKWIVNPKLRDERQGSNILLSGTLPNLYETYTCCKMM